MAASHICSLFSRRTVIRALKKIEAVRFIRKIRHGGKLHRNCYLPNWIRFREIEAAWKARQKTRHWQSDPSASPSENKTCHLAGGQSVTQTIPSNQSNRTTGPQGPSTSAKKDDENASNTSSVIGQLLKKPDVSHGPALVEAERRWSTDLHNRYSRNEKVYAQIVEAIDAGLQKAATQAEVRERGAGLWYIESQLKGAHSPPISASIRPLRERAMNPFDLRKGHRGV